MTTGVRCLRLYRFGTQDYATAWRWQLDTAAEVRAGADDVLALLEHPPTITLGRRTRDEHLLLSRAEIERHGATIVRSDRGGDVTFHGPDQVVAYPILNLRRRDLGAVDYVRGLEQIMIDVLRRFGLPGERVKGRPGVWLGGDKVGAIGVRVQGGVTTHGLALNVEPDLAWFEAIVPCGIEDAGVTSMARALGRRVDPGAVADAVVEAFGDVFGYELAAAPNPGAYTRGH